MLPRYLLSYFHIDGNVYYNGIFTDIGNLVLLKPYYMELMELKTNGHAAFDAYRGKLV